MSGRHRKPSNTGRTVAKVAVTSAVIGGAGVAFAGTANAATDSQWDRVAQCESGGNWGTNTGNGYQGGLQFSQSTWSAYGGQKFAPSANQASKDQQIAVAEKVLAGQGKGAWPVCGTGLGAATQREAPVNEVPAEPAPAAPVHHDAPAQQPAEHDQATDTLNQAVDYAKSNGITVDHSLLGNVDQALNAAKAQGVNIDPGLLSFYNSHKDALAN